MGLAVIGAVLVAVPITGHLLGPGARGTAVAEPPPPPPAVGDCLLDRTAALPFWPPTQDNQPAPAELVPCSGFRFAEVVAILDGPFGAVDPETGVDPMAQECSDRASAYIGVPSFDPLATAPAWFPPTGPLLLAAGPDDRQPGVDRLPGGAGLVLPRHDAPGCGGRVRGVVARWGALGSTAGRVRGLRR